MELKNLRKKLKLTQTEVASLLGMSSQRYNKYELEINEPDVDTLKKLANVFKTSIDEIVGYKSPLKLDNRYTQIVEILNTCNDNELELILQFIKALKYSK